MFQIRKFDVISKNTRSSFGRISFVLLLLGLGISLLVVLGDVSQLRSAFAAFRWTLITPILLLTLVGYVLRFIRWQIYLRRLNVPPLPLLTSVLVFLSGFSMAVTPGKAGEVLKCVELRRLTGAPVNRTSAAVLIERVTDTLAMLLLAGIGVIQFAYGRLFLGAGLMVTIAVIAVLQRPDRFANVVRIATRWSVINRIAEHASTFFGASRHLVAPRLLVIATTLSLLAWGAECGALFLVLLGLGVPVSWNLLLVAIFVMATSTLLGAVSMLPGGLGIADASVAGLLVLLLSDDVMTRGLAAAAALLIRFATLWFGLLVGLAALALLHRRHHLGVDANQRQPDRDRSAPEQVVS